jgi:hypothetical protein
MSWEWLVPTLLFGAFAVVWVVVMARGGGT